MDDKLTKPVLAFLIIIILIAFVGLTYYSAHRYQENLKSLETLSSCPPANAQE